MQPKLGSVAWWSETPRATHTPESYHEADREPVSRSWKRTRCGSRPCICATCRGAVAPAKVWPQQGQWVSVPRAERLFFLETLRAGACRESRRMADSLSEEASGREGRDGAVNWSQSTRRLASTCSGVGCGASLTANES